MADNRSHDDELLLHVAISLAGVTLAVTWSYATLAPGLMSVAIAVAMLAAFGLLVVEAAPVAVGQEAASDE